jgi:hypothetical protein
MSKRTVRWKRVIRQAGGNLGSVLPQGAKGKISKVTCCLPMKPETLERVRKLAT